MGPRWAELNCRRGIIFALQELSVKAHHMLWENVSIRALIGVERGRHSHQRRSGVVCITSKCTPLLAFQTVSAYRRCERRQSTRCLSLRRPPSATPDVCARYRPAPPLCALCRRATERDPAIKSVQRFQYSVSKKRTLVKRTGRLLG